MSKTQLQTNNEKLTALITELEGKAVGGPIDPVLQSKTVTPTISDQLITADNGYDGLSDVTVEGDANLVAANIAEGVSIFGVTGTHATGSPAKETCTVNISSSYNGYCGVVWTTVENNEIVMKNGYVYGTYLSTYYSSGIKCLKNSYLLFGVPTTGTQNFTATVTGGVEVPDTTTQAANTYGLAFYITDDATIDLASA